MFNVDMGCHTEQVRHQQHQQQQTSERMTIDDYDLH